MTDHDRTNQVPDGAVRGSDTHGSDINGSDTTDSDLAGSAIPDSTIPDSGEAGNYVEPVDLGGVPDVVVEGTDPAVDKGDFTTSTDFGQGQSTPPNVLREDGDYTTSQSHENDAVDDGEYTDIDPDRS